MNLETPEDLQDIKCPKCQDKLKRFGKRTMMNFKCQSRDCSRFYSETRLREYLQGKVE